MSLLLLVIAFMAIGLLQGLALLRQRYWRDLAIFGSTWGLALVLSLLIAFEVPFPRFFVLLNQLARAVTGSTP